MTPKGIVVPPTLKLGSIVALPSRAAGCDGYIAKPLAYKDFLATIAARLVKASAA